MAFNWQVILNLILAILQSGKGLGLFDADGNPVHTPEALETHLTNRLGSED